MAQLFSKSYTKKELLSYCGNIDQIASVTPFELTEGRAKGLSGLKVKTGSGLMFDILTDKGLDIGSLSYKGINISFLAKPGETSTKFAYPFADEFLHYFSGGMLWTCGMQNAGPASTTSDNKFHPIHGRVGITPASDICKKAYFEGDEYIILIEGSMKEAELFGQNLRLTRQIKTRLGSSEIEIYDKIENLTPNDTHYIMLYHFNLGFPFLNNNLKLKFSENELIPRTDEAKKGISTAGDIQKPTDNYSEQVFFRLIKPDKNNYVTVEALNDELKIGLKISYDSTNLPIFTQWKSMASGDYALGLEPSNTKIRGRNEEIKAGEAPVIKAYGQVEFNLKLKLFDI